MSNKLSPTEKNLIVSFLHFLRQKMSTGQVNEEQSESLEVAMQCMEAAFSLTDADKAFHPSKPLEKIFADAEPLSAANASLMQEASESEKAEAERLKNEGNELMKQEKYEPAVEKYTEAIRIHRNPVFFCNRAAAYSKTEKFDMSIQDCKTAISLDPTYGKAYGRMGLALSCQNRYREAADAYKRAVELDPDNESFRNNLDIAEQKARENPPPQANPFAGLGGGMDIGSMLNNPAMMEMAQQVMADPQMQNLMSGLMGGQQAGGAGLDSLMRAGQQLASQMQAQNPDLVEHLRRQMGGGGGPPGDPGAPPGPGQGGSGGNNPGPGQGGSSGNNSGDGNTGTE